MIFAILGEKYMANPMWFLGKSKKLTPFVGK